MATRERTQRSHHRTLGGVSQITRQQSKAQIMDTDDTATDEGTFTDNLDPELDAYLRDCVTVPTDAPGLKDHLARVPADLARWANLHALAHRRVGEVESDYRRTEGELWEYYKDKLVRIKGKATDKDVHFAVRCDPKYTAAKAKLASAEADVLDLKGVCDSQKAKLQSMITMGTLVRAEMSDPTIKKP